MNNHGPNGTVPCHFGCGRQLNPTQAWQAGHDWKRGNTTTLRTPHTAFACDRCIQAHQPKGRTPT